MWTNLFLDTNHKETVPLPLQKIRAKNFKRMKKQKTKHRVLKEEDHSKIGKRMQASVCKYVLTSVKYIKQKNVLITRNMKRSHNMYH